MIGHGSLVGHLIQVEGTPDIQLFKASLVPIRCRQSLTKEEARGIGAGKSDVSLAWVASEITKLGLKGVKATSPRGLEKEQKPK